MPENETFLQEVWRENWDFFAFLLIPLMLIFVVCWQLYLEIKPAPE